MAAWSGSALHHTTMPPPRKASATGKDNSQELHTLFTKVFGAARWSSLLPQLVANVGHVALRNALCTGPLPPGMVPVFESGAIQCFR